MSILIDRRLNDRKKNTVNRERFIRRYKQQIKGAVADMVSKRGITDMEQGGVVNIPNRDVSEPNFSHGPGGDHEYVLPGNHSYSPGDQIERQKGGGGGEGGEGGGSDDNFSFVLSREEFMKLFFDDLELPHLLRNALGDAKDHQWRRAGYTPTGVPANLAIARSLKQAFARRIALSGPLKKRIAELEALLADGSAKETAEEEIWTLKQRLRRIPYLDDFDLRYRHRVKEPRPISRAVMFCLMDVSASMTEEKKDLAKRFFTLLFLFLVRKYERVELVFIRHTDNAQEVDEDTFFHDKKSGGTVVLSALKLMSEIVGARYPTESWNIYGAQVSDGDAFGADPEKSRAFVEDELLPRVRYYAYIETPDDPARTSPLGYAYHRIEAQNFAMKCVTNKNEVYPVLRELFAREAMAWAH